MEFGQMVCMVCSDTYVLHRNRRLQLFLVCVADSDAASDSPLETTSEAYDVEDSAQLAVSPLDSFLKLIKIVIKMFYRIEFLFFLLS